MKCGALAAVARDQLERAYSVKASITDEHMKASVQKFLTSQEARLPLLRSFTWMPEVSDIQESLPSSWSDVVDEAAKAHWASTFNAWREVSDLIAVPEDDRGEKWATVWADMQEQFFKNDVFQDYMMSRTRGSPKSTGNPKCCFDNNSSKQATIPKSRATEYQERPATGSQTTASQYQKTATRSFSHTETYFSELPKPNFLLSTFPVALPGPRHRNSRRVRRTSPSASWPFTLS